MIYVDCVDFLLLFLGSAAYLDVFDAILPHVVHVLQDDVIDVLFLQFLSVFLDFLAVVDVHGTYNLYVPAVFHQGGS